MSVLGSDYFYGCMRLHSGCRCKINDPDVVLRSVRMSQITVMVVILVTSGVALILSLGVFVSAILEIMSLIQSDP